MKTGERAEVRRVRHGRRCALSMGALAKAAEDLRAVIQVLEDLLRKRSV